MPPRPSSHPSTNSTLAAAQGPQSLPTLPLLGTNTIVFGADVTHPAPGSSKPSISALVCTRDASYVRMLTEMFVQDSRVEIIADLKNAKLAMHGKKVIFILDLAAGKAEATTWGCDLTEKYVEINGRYTT